MSLALAQFKASVQPLMPLGQMLSPSCWFVDCAEALRNGILDQFPRANVYLCLYHVHHAMFEGLRQRVSDANAILVAQAIDDLTELTHLPPHPLRTEAQTRQLVSERWNDILKRLEGERAACAYLESQWRPLIELWCHAFRLANTVGVDTTNHVESFHQASQ